MSETAALARRDAGLAPLAWTPDQKQIILDTYASGASEEEFSALLEIASARRLDPRLRQIWFVKRWDSQKRREVWACQVSIDGLRAIAERTGQYDGQDEVEYEHDEKGGLISARATVYRRDWSRPCSVRVYLDEYIQTKKDGGPTAFWAKSPRMMLGKVAEAAALRKAFSEELSGLHISEEATETAPAAAAPVAEHPSRKMKKKEEAPAHDVVTGEVVEEEPPALSGGAPALVDQIAAAMHEAQDEAQLRKVGARIKSEADLSESDVQHLRSLYLTRQREIHQ